MYSNQQSHISESALGRRSLGMTMPIAMLVMMTDVYDDDDDADNVGDDDGDHHTNLVWILCAGMDPALVNRVHCSAT